MGVKESLASFYDAQADTYHQTRNKHRSDADFFLDELQKSGKTSLHILELGCGSGRLLAYLKSLTGITITYTGVDISKNLIQLAKRSVTGKSASKHLHTTFVCDDIAHYLKGLKQETFDFVIGAASFQHIPTAKERFFIMKNIYRVLNYDGVLIMTNRSFSRWFIKKYQTDLIAALWQFILSLGKHPWNDLLVPWKSGAMIYKRFYHIFTLAELKRIVSLSGFVIEKLCYLNVGKIADSRKTSQNSLVIAKKSIFLQNDED